MLKKISGKIKNLVRDNNGSAIVLVIIALAMVGILAVTIMWMSMTNYYMKATDKGNKQGFYASETVLEQIKAGVEEDASMAASRAYAFILTKDYSALSTTDRDYEFKQRYMNYFVDIVCSPSDRTKYSVEHLRKYVDSSIQPSLTKQTSGKINWLSTTSGSGEGNLFYDPAYDMIKIEGLHLEFTDTDAKGSDFLSIIDTDIIINIPDVSFTQMATVPDVFEYALVANTGVDIGVAGQTTLKGSMYAGENGIKMADALTISDANNIISKGDVIIGAASPAEASSPTTKLTITGKSGTKNTEFWANDIRLGNGVSLITDKVDTYVADDMTLAGRKSTVKMTGNGNYYGYGASTDTASDSSAVVINGLGSTVDMDELKNVLLFGRTFVSVPNQEPYRDPETGVTVVSTNSIDFAMGESLAVKGEQVAFLVPDVCISYQNDDGSIVKLSNPFMTTSDYKEDHLRINLSDYSAFVPSNGWKPIYPNGVGGLAYVYMTMSGDKANEYYEAFYKNNKDKLDNYFLVYSGSGKVEVPAGAGTLTEGNFITAIGGYTTADPEYTGSNSQLNKANSITGKEELSDQYKLTKNNLCIKLMKEGITGDDTDNLFDNLIRHRSSDDQMGELLSRNSNPFVFDTTEGYQAVFAKTSPGSPYEYTDDKIRVLIVDGDIHVTKNFTGLMIASGTVTIDTGVNITSIINASDADMQALKDAIQVKKDVDFYDPSTGSLATEERQALQYFVDGSEYDIDGLQSHSSSTVSANRVDFTELVKFNNWVKR